MTPSASSVRAARLGAALAGTAGVLVLAGCGSADAASSAGTTTGDASYADGTYEASGSYATPESVESIDVTVELTDGMISAVEVVGDPTRPESERYQERFIGGISDEVVGKSLDDISVSRVAGSSLTSGGFNEAIEQIKSDARQ
ncbi:hypothetical protein NQ156_00445 [Microbacterium sp. zg.Y625]|uniref:FMN-binding protein n=1 Tax=Microbacterium jiangjiandongii TaxID=3049071 RepID=UPI00214C112A|nr:MULTISPECIES: hypothetical protein [unclassified Microbacterium]MCR2791530.1 hypothetical protein [Microbacterium sp. zg.Y625]MCR2817017.1 hypothetical protein [Microbacterium sp. zg.Y843]WIM24358.1 hypothetical protein QNO14_09365 [Microbacterium sp. zg-Y625]